MTEAAGEEGGGNSESITIRVKDAGIAYNSNQYFIIVKFYLFLYFITGGEEMYFKVKKTTKMVCY
jgi:hypothetical protein